MKKLNSIHKIIIIFFTAAIVGFCIITNNSGDPRSYLPEALPLVIQMNVDTPNEYDQVIEDALAVWNNVEGCYFDFALGSRTNANGPGADGINLLYFDANYDNFEPGSNTIAFSSTRTSTEGGVYHAVESDYIYNAAGYPPATDGSSNRMDLMTITLHEVGHHMGLNHHGPAGNSNGAGSSGCGPNLPEQVMYWSVGQGTLKRQLFLHDEMGAVAIYPNFVVDGLVRDASNNDPLYNAKVAFDEGTYAAYVGPVEFAVGRAMTPGEVYTTYPTPNSGDFFLAMNRGVFNFTVSKFGYESSQVYEVNMSTPTTYGDTRVEEFVIDLQPTVRGDVSGFLKDVLKDSALTGSVKLTWVGDENEVFEIAPEADGSFSIEVPSDEYYNVEISLEEPYDPVTYLDSVYIPAEGLELDLDIRPSNVLIVYDNDVTESMKEKYETKFNSLKIGHANWDISSKGISPSASTVSLYSEPLTIFWVAGGDTTSNLESDEINFLTSHLDAGNRLVLTGSNISEYIDSTSSLLPDYAGVKFKGNNSSFKINGITGDRIGDGISANLLGSGKDVVEFSTSQMGEVNQTLYFGTSIADSGNIAGVRSQNSEQGWKFVFFTESIDKILDTNLDTLIYRSIEYCLDSNFVNSVRIKNEDILANRYSISQNYPNPFNPSTTIKFALPVSANVRLTIYNILGEQVEVLKNGQMNAGSYELRWDATKSSISSGIYFYRIEADGINGSKFADTKKMILLK